MTETQAPVHAPGTPIWIDIASHDLEATRSFYSALLGWDAFTVPDPEAGGYTMFLLNGKQVGAASPAQTPEGPDFWSIYFGTPDGDEIARRVEEAGGTVVMPPFDVLNAGRIGVFTDPAGAFFCIWQPGEHTGFEAVGVPGSFCWAELNTRDLAGAHAFYRQVFGWGTDTNDIPGVGPYTEWKLDGASIGGAVPMGDNMPAEIPSHWLPYLAVEDTDATVARAQELGGRVVVPPMDIAPGRFAIMTDTGGAAFAVLTFGA